MEKKLRKVGIEHPHHESRISDPATYGKQGTQLSVSNEYLSQFLRMRS